MARERKIETSFVQRTGVGKGVGIAEAVAAAEARLETMRDGASAKIGEMIDAMQASRAGVAARDVEAMKFARVQADALVGLSALFGLPEIGDAAASLCKLFDQSEPELPSPDAVGVHLDALRMFWSADPATRAAAAPQMLNGLRQIALGTRAAAN